MRRRLSGRGIYGARPLAHGNRAADRAADLFRESRNEFVEFLAAGRTDILKHRHGGHLDSFLEPRSDVPE